MHLALPAQPELTRHRIRPEHQRAVLIHQPRHRSSQFHIVRPVLRLHCQRIRWWPFRRLHRRLARHPIGRHQVATHRPVEPPETHNIARPGAIHLLLRLAMHREDARHAFLRPVRQRHLIAIGNLARQHPHHRLPPGLPRMLRADHHRRCAIRRQPCRSRPQRRRLMPQRLQQPPHARPLLRRSEKHRHDLHPAHLVREVRHHEISRRLPLIDQLLHQPVVEIRHLLQHAIARFRLALAFVLRNVDQLRWLARLVRIGPLQREIDIAKRARSIPDRYLPRHQWLKTIRLQCRDQFAHAPARLVDLVDENAVRRLQLIQPPQDRLQQARPQRIRFRHHNRHVDGGQHHVPLRRKIHRPRAVHHHEPVAHILEPGDIQLRGQSSRPRFLAGVAHR